MFDYLGIDWGKKRIGLAYGDKETGLIIPDREERVNYSFFDQIGQIIKDKNIKKIIVGVPTNFEFGDTDVSKEILEFINQLKSKFSEIEIDVINERNSTKDAKNDFIGSNINKFDINHLAAVKILEYYFEFH